MINIPRMKEGPTLVSMRWYSCAYCRFLSGETRGKKHFISCSHPDFGKPRFIGRDQDQTPDWCPIKKDPSPDGLLSELEAVELLRALVPTIQVDHNILLAYDEEITAVAMAIANLLGDRNRSDEKIAKVLYELCQILFSYGFQRGLAHWNNQRSPRKDSSPPE